MFSSLTSSFTEGIKRLSLDALQEEEKGDNSSASSQRANINPEGNDNPSAALAPKLVPELPTIPEVPQRVEPVDARTDEWEWNEDDSSRIPRSARRTRKSATEQSKKSGTPVSGALATSASTTLPHDSVVGPSPSENDDFLGHGATNERNLVDRSLPMEKADFLHRSESSDPSTCIREATGEDAEDAALRVTSRGTTEEGFPDAVDESASKRSQACEASLALATKDSTAEIIPADGGTFQSDDCGPRGAASGEIEGGVGGGAAGDGETEALTVGNTADDGLTGVGVGPVAPQDAGILPESSRDDGSATVEFPEELDQSGRCQDAGAQEVQGAPAAAREVAEVIYGGKDKLAAAKALAGALQAALEESRAQIAEVRGALNTQATMAQTQARKMASLRDELEAARMGFRESTEAHQRTAERSLAFEGEVKKQRGAVESLRAENAALTEQARIGVEQRQDLEGQLRRLRTEMVETQEAERQQARKGVDELEARVKDLLKDKDRRQAELGLQNARRKETREMARDLESQLAAVERIAQEREEELKQMKEQMSSLRREADEAKEKQATYVTKYEALERNFKQVRAQGKHVDSELDDLRQAVARLEADKAALAEKVEEERAERVTVVSSMSHERDFLLRQVDRFEQELMDLHREKEAQYAAAGARAQAAGHLEEYRTRAQQALKRANEITTQITSEKKRLEAELAELLSEVARERPQWESSKESETTLKQEVDRLSSRLKSASDERDSKTAELKALKSRLAAGGQEDTGSMRSTITRLEAQSKSLKQELQRHQKALVAANEREAALQSQIAEKDVALQAAEARENRESAAVSSMELKSDFDSFPPSPVQGDSRGWEEEYKASAERGEAAEGDFPVATLHEAGLGLRNSFRSVSTEGESADMHGGSVAEQLVYVQQLRERMAKEQLEMRSVISELESSRTEREAQARKVTQLEKKLEAALLANTRLQDLDIGRNAAVNLEYLKNCVVGCLRTSEPSEHARLLPVISTILKLSKDEEVIITRNISSRAHTEGSFGGSLQLRPSANGGTWWTSKGPGR